MFNVDKIQKTSNLKKTIDAKKEETCKLFDARAIAQMMCHFSSWWNTSTCSIRVGLISRKLKLDVIFSRIHSVDSNQLKCCQIWIQYRWILKLSCVVALHEISRSPPEERIFFLRCFVRNENGTSWNSYKYVVTNNASDFNSQDESLLFALWLSEVSSIRRWSISLHLCDFPPFCLAFFNTF